MIALAQVLEFKFPGVEGLRTREKASHPEPFDPWRDMEIFDWPAAATGRAKPTRATLNAWRVEFEALPPWKAVDVLSEVVDVLVGKGVMVVADLSPDARTEIADRKAKRR